MANVIVSTFTNLPGGLLDSFRQGFIDALVKAGNHTLLFKTNQFFEDFNANNSLKKTIDEHQLIKRIKDFNPDLFISINHSGLFERLANSLDCPIAIWLLDGPPYLIEADQCKKQSNRYHMYIATPAFRKDLIQSFAIKNSQIHDLPFASDFKAYDNHQIHNISFIGTNFNGPKFLDIITKFASNRSLISRIRTLIQSYDENLDMIFQDRLKRYGLESVFVENFDEAHILNNISINKRIKILDAIENLGLALYGTADWFETIKYSVGLALSFDSRPILTKTDAESIYNASKISLNISHIQARGGLPWRIFDIMSCNSALVSDYQEDLIRLFGKDIEIPIYNNVSEVRTICEQLLNDDSRRQTIIESCNKAIETGHRFKHRLKTISEVSGIDLLPTKEGSFKELNATDFHKSNKATPFSKQSFKNSHDTKYSSRTLSLQLFQSNSLDFISENSILINIEVPADKQINGTFEITQSLPFLRLDIGEYFSQHTNVKISISAPSSSNGNELVLLDLKKDILQVNDFYLQADKLTCGFDSFCVFENPFPQKNIKLYFESSLVEGL